VVAVPLKDTTGTSERPASRAADNRVGQDETLQRTGAS